MTSTEYHGVYVPPATERERIPQEAIDDVVCQIAEQFDPERIILFGSYAYGTPRPDSDVDLLVVMDTALGEIQQEIAILRALRKHFALDLLVRKPAFLARRIAIGDPFLREITQRGRVLYARNN
jgi:uncharacterized protein